MYPTLRGPRRLGCPSDGLGATLPAAIPTRTVRVSSFGNRAGSTAYTPPASSPITQPWGSSVPTYNGGFTASSAATGANGSTSTARRKRGTQASNTTGAPSTILDYDAYGNPVYSVPPAGQAITGYDAAGTPIYNGQSSGSGLRSQPSAATGVITGYDAAGNPTYSTPPSGQTVVGTDAYGNPIYSGSAAAAQLANTQAATTAAAATPAAASTGDYQSVLDWLSEATLISGVPNWGIVAALGVAVVYMQNRGRR